MEKTEILETTIEHVRSLQGNLRKADILEVERSSEHSADWCLEEGFKITEDCKTILLNGDPIAVFGISSNLSMSSIGVPWMLGKEDLYDLSSESKIDLLIMSKEFIQDASKRFSVMMNYVDSENIKSIKWLKFCGFTVEAALPYGKKGHPFHKFYLTGV